MLGLKVLNNCAIGGCSAKNVQSTCPECVHWTPSRSSKYYQCSWWWTTHRICKLPRSACETCEYHITKDEVPVGRPNETGIDWSDPDQVREYNREKKRKERRQEKDEEAQRYAKKIKES